MLKTGWSHWDTFLSKYVGQQLNIMEIGVYEGEATSWFLRNLMSNKESKIYAIETFKGSPEYIDTDFSIVKKTFFKNIKETKRDNQVILMEMMSFVALNQLIYEKKMLEKFDIIFIDASHEANNVIIDAVLSWNLLKTGGIMILDDYRWKKIVQKNYRPALAIDAFLDIFKPEIKILNIGWQIIIEKIVKDESDYPIVTENIFNEINIIYDNFFELFYKFNNIKLESHNNKIKFNIEFDKIEKLYESNNITQYLNTTLQDKKTMLGKKYLDYQYVLPSFFLSISEKSIIFEENQDVKNKVLKFKNYIFKKKKSLSESLNFMKFFYDNSCFICYSENLFFSLKTMKNKTNLSFLNFDYRVNIDNNSELYDITKELIKNETFTFYNIQVNQDTDNIKKLSKDNFDTYKNMKINYIHFYSFDDIIFLSKLLKNKLDMINISLIHIDNYIIKSKIFSTLIFYYCFFILSIQKLNGSVNIVIPLFNDKLIYDIIYIFCKYYNNIQLKINLCKTTMTNSFVLFLFHHVVHRFFYFLELCSDYYHFHLLLLRNILDLSSLVVLWCIFHVES